MRKFLRGIHRKSPKNQIITKVDFKYYTTNFGLNWSDADIEFIYKKYDINNKSEINFNEFLNDLQFINEKRMQYILDFFNQLKNKNNIVTVKKIEELVKPEIHPEVK